MPKKIKKKTHTPPPKKLSLGLRLHRAPPLETSSSESSSQDNSKERPTRSITSPTLQPHNRISAWFDNMQPSVRSQASSPDLEATPRPLRVLKGRKSFLKLDIGLPSRAGPPTPQPQPFRRVSGTLISDGSTHVSDSTPPTRSFLGLRLSSPKPHIPPPLNLLGPTIPESKRPVDVRFSLGNILRGPLPSEIDLSRQVTEASDGTTGSSSSLLALTNVSQWISWKQRSSSDGSNLKTHSHLIDRGPSRTVNIVHPSTVYGSMRHVEAELAPAINPTSRQISYRRRATSAGPGYLPFDSAVSSIGIARPLTPRPTTLSNIGVSRAAQIGGKPGVFSKVLCSVQDMSPLSGSRFAGTVSVDETPIKFSGNEANNNNTASVPGSLRKGDSSERSKPLDISKGKGSFRARGTLGSIRRRFGSASAKTLEMAEENVQLIQQENNTLPNGIKRWAHPPILKLQLGIRSESSREHVQGGKEIWACIEIEGRVSDPRSSSVDMCCERSRRGLDIAIILDLSAYASPSTFEETKATAKDIINSLSSIDNVSLTAFTSIPSAPGVETIYPLSRLTQDNKQQLLGFIDGLFGQAQRQGTVRRDIKAIITTAVDELRECIDYEAPSGHERTGHVFLLTSSLRHGDLPQGQTHTSGQGVKVHFLGIGPLTSLHEYPWKGGWVLNLGSPTNQAPVPLEQLHHSLEKFPALPQVLESLRYGLDFGELTNVQIGLTPCEKCKIVEILGDTVFQRLLPGEKRTILVKLRIGPYNPASAPGSTVNTPDKRKAKLTPGKESGDRAFENLRKIEVNQERGDVSECKILERQLAATLGDIETKALVVTVNYEHEYFGPDTIILCNKSLKIQRFDGDGNWSLSRASASNAGQGHGRQAEAKDPSINLTNSIAMNTGELSSYDEYNEHNEDIEYVRTMLAKKVAEMTIGDAEENPKKALRAVEDWGIRGKGVHAVASELEWRIKIREEEEEAERTMNGLAAEFQRDTNYRAGQKMNIGAGLLGDRLNRGTGDNSIVQRHSIWPNREFSGANTTIAESEGDSTEHEIQQGDASTARLRHSSVVIHPIVSTDGNTSPASDSDEADGCTAHPPSHIIGARTLRSQNGRRRQDHGDEAGRIWREMAEGKMGLRRDVKPSRYRRPGTPLMSRHSRHNSLDLLRERHDKERTGKIELDWALGPGGVKDKQRDRRRRIRRQAMKRKSMNGDQALKDGVGRKGSIDCVLSTNSRIEDPSRRNIKGKSPDDLSDVTPTSEDCSSEHAGQDIPPTPHTLEETDSIASHDHSNRDTLKSLITLRDIKETDFSPWAY